MAKLKSLVTGLVIGLLRESGKALEHGGEALKEKAGAGQ